MRLITEDGSREWLKLSEYAKSLPREDWHEIRWPSEQGGQTILSIRWDVETFFEYDKDLLGSDHDQLMTAQGVLRFWTLTACLIAFLEEQRGPSKVTCGDVRRDLQLDHRRNMLLWLGDRFTTGQSVDQILSQLAL